MSTETTAPQNDLVSFMIEASSQMQSEYERIFRRSLEDPGTAGDEGEQNWAELLRNWLPSNYHVATKGRLMNEKGEASPQVDVLVLRPFYPRGLLHKKLYVTSGVAAAFECKNTLKASHIEKAFENSAIIQRMVKRKSGDPKTELNGPIIYGLLAHSHAWTGAQSDPHGNIEKHLFDGDAKFVKHPAECLDVLCVSDLVLWSSHKTPVTMRSWTEGDHHYYRNDHGVLSGYGKTWRGMFAEGSVPHASTTPIGALMARLLLKLSLTDPALFDTAVYYRQSGIWGGAKLHWRDWPADTLSDAAKRRVELEGYLREHWPFD